MKKIVLFLSINVDALVGSTAISETPSSTEKGNYITLKHTIDVQTNEVSIDYTYDNKYLQLVGFEPTNNASCKLEKNTITCNDVKASSTFVYPIFKIVSNFDNNKDITATFKTTETQNITQNRSSCKP